MNAVERVERAAVARASIFDAAGEAPGFALALPHETLISPAGAEAHGVGAITQGDQGRLPFLVDIEPLSIGAVRGPVVRTPQ